MSDGNFNRQLLPANPYRSGLQVGRQQMRQKALETIREVLVAMAMPDDERERIVRAVSERL